MNPADAAVPPITVNHRFFRGDPRDRVVQAFPAGNRAAGAVDMATIRAGDGLDRSVSMIDGVELA